MAAGLKALTILLKMPKWPCVLRAHMSWESNMCSFFWGRFTFESEWNVSRLWYCFQMYGTCQSPHSHAQWSLVLHSATLGTWPRSIGMTLIVKNQSGLEKVPVYFKDVSLPNITTKTIQESQHLNPFLYLLLY